MRMSDHQLSLQYFLSFGVTAQFRDSRSCTRVVVFFKGSRRGRVGGTGRGDRTGQSSDVLYFRIESSD